MTYEAWRCTFQSAEAAARAAYGQVQGAVAEAAGLREKLEARCPGLVQIQEPAVKISAQTLTEQDAELLNQAIEMLKALATHRRKHGIPDCTHSSPTARCVR